MIEIKKYLWAFPLIGGLITLISFFTPAAFFFYRYPTYRTEFYRWMLDFYVSLAFYDNGTQTITTGLNTSITGYISWTCSILIIALNILIILSANKYRKENLAKQNKWLIFAIITITIVIVWMIMKEINTQSSFGHSFWGLLSPGFGIIGPYVGAGLEIIGFFLSKKKLRTT
ncbi:MAG: hypothetical protein ACFFC1_17210 [Promethearchaeota archaeon]